MNDITHNMTFEMDLRTEPSESEKLTSNEQNYDSPKLTFDNKLNYNSGLNQNCNNPNKNNFIDSLALNK